MKKDVAAEEGLRPRRLANHVKSQAPKLEASFVRGACTSHTMVGGLMFDSDASARTPLHFAAVEGVQETVEAVPLAGF